MAWLIESYNGFDSDVYEDYMTCSVDKILEVCKLFNMQPLTEAEQLEILSESTSKTTNAYKKLGVKNPDKISSLVAKASSNIASTIKKDGISKSSKEHVQFILNQLYDNIEKNLEIQLDIKDSTDTATATKIKQSVMLLFVVFTVSLVCSIVLCTVFGGTAGNILSAVIIAPIVEEASKQIAIKGNYIKEYTIIFNTFEASEYIIKYTLKGIPFLTMVKTRLIAAGMHVTTTIIQWLTQNTAIQKKLGIENDEKGKDMLRTIGNVTGLIIHATWNTLAIFG